MEIAHINKLGENQSVMEHLSGTAKELCHMSADYISLAMAVAGHGSVDRNKGLSSDTKLLYVRHPSRK